MCLKIQGRSLKSRTNYGDLSSNCSRKAYKYASFFSQYVIDYSSIQLRSSRRTEMDWLLFILLLLDCRMVITIFTPDTSDFDAYGVKIAANAILFAQAKNQEQTFLVQLNLPNVTVESSQCIVEFDDPKHYVYSVAVGAKQSSTINPYFFYSGEVLSQNGQAFDEQNRNGTIIAVVIKGNVSGSSSQSRQSQSPFCDLIQHDAFAYLPSYDHQEYSVIAVEPNGRYAIGIATDFVFRYEPYPSSNMTSKSTSSLWPNNATFQPCAADASDSFTIIAGFVKTKTGQVRAIPTVYLLSNNHLTVLASWSYTAVNSSWQSHLTYSGVDSWNRKLTMSVKINGDDPTRVLVGMPFLNTVFLFQVSSSGRSLSMASSISYLESVGFGKSVTWLSSTQAAILFSAYAPDYTTWYRSLIYVYAWLNDTNLPSSPTAVIPNSQQPLPSTINGKFIRLISTPKDIAILDPAGGAMLILSEQAGFYPSTDIFHSPVAAAMPVISHPTPCIGGMYKVDAGIHPCVLCPAGTRRAMFDPATNCTTCSLDGYCPLGAISEVDNASLTSVSQAVAYPRSPELMVYEDLLINNMVTFGSTAHCRRVSPMFWTVILAGIALVIILAMASLSFCVKEPKRTEWRTNMKKVLLRADLVVSLVLRPMSFRTIVRLRSRAKARCGSAASPHSLSF